jgi:hypothetical protein
MGWLFRVLFVTKVKFFLLPLQLYWLWGKPSLYVDTKGSSHTIKTTKAFGAKIKTVLSLQYLQHSKYLHDVGQDNFMFMYSL